MAVQSRPRVRVPATAKAGEVIEIKTLISHEMESGQRRGGDGKPIPRDIIKGFRASFAGKEFFRADWHPSVSANPYQSFFFKATTPGAFEFVWTEDNGTEHKATAELKIA